MKLTTTLTFRVALAISVAMGVTAIGISQSTREAGDGRLLQRESQRERSPSSDMRMKVATADKLLSVIALLETKSVYKQGMSEGEFLRILGNGGVVVGGPPGDPTHGCPACGYGGNLARSTFRAHQAGLSPDQVYENTKGDRLATMLSGYDKQPEFLRFGRGVPFVDGLGAAHRIPKPKNGWWNLAIKIGDVLEAEFGQRK